MADHSSHQLPATFKGLQFTSPSEPPNVVDMPTPLPTAGSVILRPLYSNIVTYAKDIFRNGNPRSYPYPLPLVPGTDAICRIAATPLDTPHLKQGMLVFVSGVVRPRDNTSASPALLGIMMGYTPESHALMEGEWRNGSWAELVKVPAENVHLLNEMVLTKQLGYAIEDLGYISTLAVAYGGLSDIGMKAGKTIIVAPATGSYGSAAVFVALAMGAKKVIAMGRNLEKLQGLIASNENRVVCVPITGDVEKDASTLQAHGPIDMYFDISPNIKSSPTHVQSAFMALRPKGRVSLMGGILANVKLPYFTMVVKGLRVQGTFMYTREQVDDLIGLVESGLLLIGKRGGIETSGKFPLQKWEEAIDFAFDEAAPRKNVYFVPNEE